MRLDRTAGTAWMRARTVAWLVPFAAGLAACDADSTTGGGDGGAGGSAPIETYAASECGTCALEACTEAVEACSTDPGCTNYLECLLGCPLGPSGNADPECDAACAADVSSESSALRERLNGCRFEGAGVDCAPCGLSLAPSDTRLTQECEPRPDAPTACRQCHWDNCCDTWDACFADGVNPDCDALATCIQTCGDVEDCITECFDQHPNSIQTLLDQVGCGLSQCAIDQENCDQSLRNDCEACAFETCGDSFIALMTTPAGFLLFTCQDNCPKDETNLDCVIACGEKYPEAEGASFAWAECLGYWCGSC
jgi:hypothetical protein